MGKEQEYYIRFESPKADQPKVEPEDEAPVSEKPQSMGLGKKQEYYFRFDAIKANVIKANMGDEKDAPAAEEQEWETQHEPPMAFQQKCCAEVEPWIVASIGPVPEELGCGPMEEQRLAAEMGCIYQKRGAWKILEAADEEVKQEPQEEEFKYEIPRCDAKMHPNVCHLEPPGPKAVLEPASILVVSTVGEIGSKLVKLHNVGTTCLFYSWERISKESIVDKKRVLGRHITDCWTFSVMKMKGSLLKGETQEFNFKFTSDVPGAFLESWELTIAPKLKGDRLRVFVMGFALLEDTKRENRKRLDKILAYREWQTGYVSSVLRSIFERIVAGVEWTPPDSRKSRRRFKKQKVPRLPCLRTLKAYHDRWVPHCKQEYDISPLISPPGD